MKFIVDAQLPKALSEFLKSKGHDSLHTLDMPNRNKTKDSEISTFANEGKRIVVSKDIDFLESFIIKSEPRKLIIVKTGNVSNRQLIEIFDNNLELLIRMISRSNLIEVSRTEIVEHS
ncbi:MAG: DUF5615 family PIN-like protein [Cyclobacteriaceae bacterium]|nr:DUF5615 family PIN-like protein [Cyclobacteriaceae bacterium]